MGLKFFVASVLLFLSVVSANELPTSTGSYPSLDSYESSEEDTATPSPSRNQLPAYYRFVPDNVDQVDFRTLLPGHMKPLGYGGPHQTIETHRGFISARDFYQNLDDLTPALFQHGARHLGNLSEIMKVDKWATSGRGLTTLISASSKTDTTEETMSLRNFSRLRDTDELQYEGQMPDALFSQIYLPRCLLCEGLESSIEDVLMRVHSGEETSRLRVNKFDVMLCQLSGLRKLTLVDPMSVPNKASILDAEDGQASNVDVTMVDFKKYVTLRDAIVYVVTIRPNDCVYIPNKWLFHSRIYEEDVSMSFVWRNQVSYYSCRVRVFKIPDNVTVSAIDLMQRYDDEQFNTTPFENLHQFVEKYFIPGEEITTQELQETLITQEDSLIPSLGHSSEVLAQEVFKLLDINNDGKMSDEDLDNANFKQLEAAALQLNALMEQAEKFKKDFEKSAIDETAQSKGDKKILDQLQTSSSEEDKQLLTDAYRNRLRKALDNSLEVFLQEQAEQDGEPADIEHKCEKSEIEHKCEKSGQDKWSKAGKEAGYEENVSLAPKKVKKTKLQRGRGGRLPRSPRKDEETKSKKEKKREATGSDNNEKPKEQLHDKTKPSPGEDQATNKKQGKKQKTGNKKNGSK